MQQPAGTPSPIVKTWKPTVAGILDIVVGAFSLIGALFMIAGIVLLSTAASWLGITQHDLAPMTVGAFIALLAFVTVIVSVIGVLAVVGGVCALQRKKWGLALAGSIAAVLGSTVIGVLAIIFLAMGKEEFV